MSRYRRHGYEVWKNTSIGVRGIYRPQGTVMKDGSFDDGNTTPHFNRVNRFPPSQAGNSTGNTEYLACHNPTVGCFEGRARRYYPVPSNLRLTEDFRITFHFFSSFVCIIRA